MEGVMESSAVTLVVKTPNRSIGDLQISCALNWTVEKLKKHLSSVYPSKPESKKQRLIYSGQLLLDHQTVKEFLREHQDGKLHTVHLVCPPSSNESSPSSSSEPSSAGPSTTSSAPSTPTQTTAQPTTDGLRYRGQNTPPLPMYMPSPQMWPMNAQNPFQAPMAPPTLQPHMNHHQLWMQHMQQMFQHQMAAAGRQPQANFMYMPPNMQMPQMPFWPYQTPAGMAPVTPPVNTTPPSPQQPIPPQPAPHQMPPQPPPQPQAQNIPQPAQPAQPRNQEVRMNAQGGIADDDEEEENQNNDWLDKIYTLCRVAILLSIVWFYSSTGRFLMLILSVLLIYMYQWGAFRWLFQNRNPQPQVNIPQPPPPQQQQQEDQEETDEADNTEEDGDSEEEVTGTQDSETQETVQPPPPPPPPPPGPSAFRVAISFVATFFTSLIPQHNEVFQGN